MIVRARVTDIKVHTLWKDEKTGASLQLLKAPPSEIPPIGEHMHPEANEWAYYLAGELESGDGTRTVISVDNTVFGFNEKGVMHGTGEGLRVIKEMVWLRFHDGPSKRIHKE